MCRSFGSTSTHNLTATHSRFASYARRFGIGQTRFSLASDIPIRPLFKYEETVFGFESENKLFFIPFHSSKVTDEVIADLANILCPAIVSYRIENATAAPSWASDFKFKQETIILNRLDELKVEADALKQSLIEFSDYRTLLHTQSSPLVESSLKVLANFYGLLPIADENFHEDARLVDNQEQTSAMIEIKGVKGGIKKTHVNQVDNHREANDLDATTPGLLLINPNMEKLSVDERLSESVHPDIVKLSTHHNVLTIRTIDLLCWMRTLEDIPVAERKQRFLSLLTEGGGLLRIEGDKTWVDKGLQKTKILPTARPLEL